MEVNASLYYVIIAYSSSAYDSFYAEKSKIWSIMMWKWKLGQEGALGLEDAPPSCNSLGETLNL